MRESAQTPPTGTRAATRGLLLVVLLLLLTDASIVLDVPVLRQVLGFLFFTTVPGFLILSVFKGNRFWLAETIVLSVGISISSMMLFGLLINWGLFSLGYTTPLSLTPLLISLSAFVVLLAVAVYKVNKRAFLFRYAGFKLNIYGKLFLIVPAVFLILSISGANLLRTSGNNTVLLLLLALITLYVIAVAVLRKRIPGSAYSGILYMLGLSLLLIGALRSNHILGVDIHNEYLLFQSTVGALHWQVSEVVYSLDTCLSVTLLPAIYQSLVSINPETFFMLFYALLFAFSPVVVYLISRKYIGGIYAFMAAVFYMSQELFLTYQFGGGRTVTAIFFVALAVMVLFHSRVTEFSRRTLLIILMTSIIISHYATSYIFLFLIFFTWVGFRIISRFVDRKRVSRKATEDRAQNVVPRYGNQLSRVDTIMAYGQKIHSIPIAIFCIILFIWFGFIVGAAFEAGVGFIADVVEAMGDFFVLEARGGGAALLGLGFAAKAVPTKIHLIVSWLAIATVGIGILATMIKGKQMVLLPGRGTRPFGILQEKFDIEYLIYSVGSYLMLGLSVTIPFVLQGYAVDRLYSTMLIPLAPFFIVGCVSLAKLVKIKASYLLILLILIPQFMSSTGLTHQIFNVPRTVILNTEGDQYEELYTYHAESVAAKWFASHADLNEQKSFELDKSAQKGNIYVGVKLVGSNKVVDRQNTVTCGRRTPGILMSQGLVGAEFIEGHGFISGQIMGYVYLRYYNISTGKFRGFLGQEHYFSEVEGLEAQLAAKALIYSSGYARILR